MAARSILTAEAATPTRHRHILPISGVFAGSSSYFSTLLILPLFKSSASSFRAFSSVNNSDYSLEPPDVRRLAETACISLTPQEVEEFTPKIRQVVDCAEYYNSLELVMQVTGWNLTVISALMGVELQSIEPALRADTEDGHLREDVPEQFENREAIISSIPSNDEPFIRVPKVLNKE